MILAKLENVVRLEEHEAIVKQLEAENKELVEGLRKAIESLGYLGTGVDIRSGEYSEQFKEQMFKPYKDMQALCKHAFEFKDEANEILNRLGKK